MENLLDLRIQDLSTASPADQSKTLEQLKQYVMSAKQLTRSELVMSIRAASALERTGQSKLASEGYGTFGEMFAHHADEQLATYGKKMLGVSRRLNLLGNELQLEGDTLDGEPFDWASYRGKVVLVDFWATWCEPCVAELPNIKKHFEEYHDRGFEVVAISLDRDRRKLEEFVRARDLPWVTLFRDGAGLDHPLATYYGVMTVPTVMLVNQEGRVVSFDVTGPELTRHLAGLLGPK
jgi:thiol-disulfide isomerase/thioredoxin